jgi:hypothetical protein
LSGRVRRQAAIDLAPLCEFRLESPQAELPHGLDSAQGGYITPV